VTTWVKPSIVAEVKFTEWTSSGAASGISRASLRQTGRRCYAGAREATHLTSGSAERERKLVRPNPVPRNRICAAVPASRAADFGSGAGTVKTPTPRMTLATLPDLSKITSLIAPSRELVLKLRHGLQFILCGLIHRVIGIPTLTSAGCRGCRGGSCRAGGGSRGSVRSGISSRRICRCGRLRQLSRSPAGQPTSAYRRRSPRCAHLSRESR
jgi:hypothetical protein